MNKFITYSQPYERIGDNDEATNRNTIFFTKSVPEKVTYKFKNGNPVDLDCGLEENAHVFCDSGLQYSVILGFVNISNNKNSYFRMQLLESNEIKL